MIHLVDIRITLFRCCCLELKYEQKLCDYTKEIYNGNVVVHFPLTQFISFLIQTSNLMIKDLCSFTQRHVIKRDFS